jgi:hypothetical protein
MSVIDEERMSNALLFLSETDDSYAIAKADMLRGELLAKRARARVFVTSEGSVEARKAGAEIHVEVCAEDDELIRATLEFEALRAKRQRAEIVIDVWRSLEASRRKS